MLCIFVATNIVGTVILKCAQNHRGGGAWEVFFCYQSEFNPFLLFARVGAGLQYACGRVPVVFLGVSLGELLEESRYAPWGQDSECRAGVNPSGGWAEVVYSDAAMHSTNACEGDLRLDVSHLVCIHSTQVKPPRLRSGMERVHPLYDMV